MSNYFDYILEESEEDIDTDLIYDETDATMAEFDSYVQEGVGVNILIGVGVLSAIGGLIALIVKLFNKDKNGTASKAKASTKEAKKDIEQAKKNGVEKIHSKYRIKIDNDNLKNNLCGYIEKLTRYIDNELIPVVESGKKIDKKIKTSMNDLNDDFSKIKKIGPDNSHNKIQQFINLGVLEHSPEGFEVSVEELAGTNTAISIFLSELMNKTKSLDKSYNKLKKIDNIKNLPKDYEEEFGKLVVSVSHFASVLAYAILEYNVDVSKELKKEISEIAASKMSGTEKMSHVNNVLDRSKGHDVDYDTSEEFDNFMNDKNAVAHFH